MKVRKKPVVVEAIRYQAALGNNRVMNWLALHDSKIQGWVFHECEISVPTKAGPIRAQNGDWIVKGVMGDFVVCDTTTFEADYEQVLTERLIAPPLVGRKVMLNGGGPEMTITKVVEGIRVTCTWKDDEGRDAVSDFPLLCLKEVA